SLFLLLPSSPYHLVLPSFPYTTLFRSPLLLAGSAQSQTVRKRWWQIIMWFGLFLALAALLVSPARPLWPARTILTRSLERHPGRSEEHTSELQSRGHLVCRLLLEKKKY